MIGKRVSCSYYFSSFINDDLKQLINPEDILNSKKFSFKERLPNPTRLIKAYNQSAATLNLLRSLTKQNIYDMVQCLEKNIKLL